MQNDSSIYLTQYSCHNGTNLIRTHMECRMHGCWARSMHTKRQLYRLFETQVVISLCQHQYSELLFQRIWVPSVHQSLHNVNGPAVQRRSYVIQSAHPHEINSILILISLQLSPRYRRAAAAYLTLTPTPIQYQRFYEYFLLIWTIYFMKWFSHV